MSSVMNIDLLRGSNSQLATRAVLVAEPEGHVLEAKLAKVNEINRTDHFFNIQVIAGGTDYYVYTHLGRTGSVGAISLIGPNNRKQAIQEFEKIYFEKTGNEWKHHMIGTDAPSSDHYQHLLTESRRLPKTNNLIIQWQYYLTNDLDHKPDGWYPYDKTASQSVEELYIDRQDNVRLTTRFVHSTSSTFTYKVDLNDMTQTNTSTQKQRPIRRITDMNNTLQPVSRFGNKVTIMKKKSNSSSLVNHQPTQGVTKKLSGKVNHSKASSTIVPKKKTRSKGKKQVEEVVIIPQKSVISTLNLRQQYVKGLLSDRSARKYLKTLQ